MQRATQFAAWFMAALGTVLVVAWIARLGGVTAPFDAFGVPVLALYLGASLGAALIGQAVGLWSTAALGVAATFLGFALVRLAVALTAGTLDEITLLLWAEIIAFFAISMWLYQVAWDLWGRIVDVFKSLSHAPLWVQVWIWAFLVPVNMVGYVFWAIDQDPLAGWVALGMTFVIIVNMAIALSERGISKLTAAPHLVPWVPLMIYAGWLWATGTAERPWYAAAVTVIFAISNAFDIHDTRRWLGGYRVKLGQAAAE